MQPLISAFIQGDQNAISRVLAKVSHKVSQLFIEILSKEFKFCGLSYQPITVKSITENELSVAPSSDGLLHNGRPARQLKYSVNYQLADSFFAEGVDLTGNYKIKRKLYDTDTDDALVCDGAHALARNARFYFEPGAFFMLVQPKLWANRRANILEVEGWCVGYGDERQKWRLVEADLLSQTDTTGQLGEF